MSEPSPSQAAAIDGGVREIYFLIESGNFNLAEGTSIRDIVTRAVSISGEPLKAEIRDLHQALHDSRQETTALRVKLETVTLGEVANLKAELKETNEALTNAFASLDKLRPELEAANKVAFTWQEVAKDFEAKMKERNEVAKEMEKQKNGARQELATAIFDKEEIERKLDESVKYAISYASKLRDQLEMAWVIIANKSGGDWTRESAEWREAAAKWRDAYHSSLSAQK